MVGLLMLDISTGFVGHHLQHVDQRNETPRGATKLYISTCVTSNREAIEILGRGGPFKSSPNLFQNMQLSQQNVTSPIDCGSQQIVAFPINCCFYHRFQLSYNRFAKRLQLSQQIMECGFPDRLWLSKQVIAFPVDCGFPIRLWLFQQIVVDFRIDRGVPNRLQLSQQIIAFPINCCFPNRSQLSQQVVAFPIGFGFPKRVWLSEQVLVFPLDCGFPNIS